MLHLLLRHGRLRQHVDPLHRVRCQREELVLVGPGGEDGGQQQVQLHQGEVHGGGLELVDQAGVAILELSGNSKTQ